MAELQQRHARLIVVDGMVQQNPDFIPEPHPWNDAGLPIEHGGPAFSLVESNPDYADSVLK